MFVSNAVAIEGFRGATLPVSAAAAKTVPLVAGTYDVKCDVDVAIRVANSKTTEVGQRPEDVTISNGYFIAAGNTIPVIIAEGRALSAIAAGAGTLYYHRVA